MSDRITRTDFCKVYVPMARKQHTALEIGKALGVDKPTDEAISQFVSQKASNYRKELKAEAEAVAVKQGLDETAAKELVEKTVSKLPKLKTRTRNSEDFGAFLDDLLSQCDSEDETPSE